MLEVPEGRYPLTRAVVTLVTLLLAQQSTWGPVPGLVGFTLHRCGMCLATERCDLARPGLLAFSSPLVSTNLLLWSSSAGYACTWTVV